MRSESNGASASTRFRDVLLVLAGVSCLLAKKWLSPTPGDLVDSYLGNLAASFAVFFLVRIAFAARSRRMVTALIALAVVELFELTDGFGVMSNVFDPFDYLANVAGVAMAFLVDALLPGRPPRKQRNLIAPGRSGPVPW